MKQFCCIAAIYLNWVAFVTGLVLFAFKGYWPLFVVWLVAVPVAAWGYIRAFPSLSQYIGYGPVGDKAPSATRSAAAHTEVTIYTALGCPFSPIVKERLFVLSQAMGFSVKEVDVTLKPGLLITRGIRTLPVVECGTWRVEGNASSEKLANMIAGSQAGEGTPVR